VSRNLPRRPRHCLVAAVREWPLLGSGHKRSHAIGF
jgi:hypothetical protein